MAESFDEKHYEWKSKDGISTFSIPDKNINIRSFYVSPDEKILLQNYHIRLEEEDSGV